jgi:hypothetical protein
VRTRSIALAASILIHAATAAVLIGVEAKNRATSVGNARKRSPIALVPFVPSTPPPKADEPRAPIEAKRARPAESPRKAGGGKREAIARRDRETPKRLDDNAGAVTVPGAAGPETQPGHTDGKAARDLSNVDLELHARAGSGSVPTIGVGVGPGATARVSPGGGAGSLEPSGDGTYVHKDSHFYAHVDIDGTVDFEGHGRGPSVGSGTDGSRPALSIPMDVNDALLGATGQDPYGYEKRKFMAATQGLRFDMYDRACKEQLASAVLEMRPRLETIWKNDRLPLSQRRLLIFQLWDQCAEDGPPDVKRTTEQIRAIIVAFIQERMPKTSEYAYSEADLESLNRTRRSVERFAPYE